jgi:hypothetical protein
MKLMAGQAGNGRLLGKVCAHQMPWPDRVLRLNQLANSTVEMHPMAAQAIIVQATLRIVFGVGEDLLIGRAVWAGMPSCVLSLVAPLAARGHLHHIYVAQMDGFGQASKEVDADVPELRGETCFVAIEACGCAMCRVVNSPDIGGHLVATCAAGAMLRGIVPGRAEYASHGQQCRQSENQSSDLDEMHHER